MNVFGIMIDTGSTALAGGNDQRINATIVFGIICALYYLCRRHSNASVAGIPRVGKAPGWLSASAAKRDFIANGMNIIDNGYRLVCSSPVMALVLLMVQTADMERIVLSPKYVDEIRAAPESVLSVRMGMCERHLGKFTTLNIILTSHLQNDVCRAQLTQNLSFLIGPINEEVGFWLNQLIPGNEARVELPGYQTMLRVIAGVTSRVLIGLPMSREKEWLDVAIGYTLDVFRVSTELRPYPPILRPFIAPWLESTQRLKDHVKTANRCLSHVFADRMRKGDGVGKPLDMIQWMVDSAQDGDRKPGVLVLKLLFITLAAVHTSTMSGTHALFDLCAMPEYIDPIRNEVRDAVERHGWTLAAVNQMKFLDSFMKESQRINHPGLREWRTTLLKNEATADLLSPVSFNHKVVRDLKLSDGTILPANAFITMPTCSIARDPQIYDNPDRFDGARFYKKRQAGDPNRHQFVSTGPDSLPFGHGKFACPGRFFAAAQIKILLANILLRYDISYPEGQVIRPANVFSGEGIGPDRGQRIVFSVRKDIAYSRNGARPKLTGICPEIGTDMLIFGGASIGAAYTTRQQVAELLQTLQSLGVTRIDTAARYPPTDIGASERLLGEAGVAELGFSVDSKIFVGSVAEGSLAPHAIEKSLTESYDRMRLHGHRLGVLHCHRPDPETPLAEQVKALDAQYRAGLFEKAGEDGHYHQPLAFDTNGSNLAWRFQLQPGTSRRVYPYLRRECLRQALGLC
ncbi:hypothetical protein O1611_g5450 [Lasiodiplodia mahajangana]|uniref:Uncharacterized protein n=1 Tax=Lasiodiplodia mahajangana TaxID=1108764 RepID=A0ACC2JLQ8_9PEZI|nr:hypothetical protein O1611_g5450 [Lasiodiplodia mahajangana]